VLDVAAGELALAGHVTALGDLHIADPALPTLLDVTVGFPEGETPADAAALRAALTEAVSLLNAANEAAGADGTTISFEQLLAVMPLPGRATPATTVDEALPYVVAFALTLETGLTQLLVAEGDTYALAPFERLSLSGVEVGVHQDAVVPVG
jgi:hypothetical protein